ncbi:MAG: hypothetical protein K2Y22_12795 [Candidatus Obscuribacterales bacterium]|nr:hypothetical protein [Candidatus Obscuribacterales bacterium]
MADAVNEAELGRSKQGATPREHLWHLLSIGWNVNAPLIQRYAVENGLRSELDEWERTSQQAPKAAKKR